MASIALGIFILGIIYVVVWSVVNDKARSIRDQSGFIRMRVPPDQPLDEGQEGRSIAPTRPSGTGKPPNRRAATARLAADERKGRAAVFSRREGAPRRR